ncbi:MAG: VPLPA-CTERM sorting domain-containing protein [Gammaproteobacteria bacterium]|nr:VPLPA-CTERM sorting domain-containing protein [Gammaproteobacteria bacterium]
MNIRNLLLTTLAMTSLMLTAPSQAASLNLTPAFPDFQLANDQAISYDATTGDLTISGGTIAGYTEASGNDSWLVTAPESFSLSATFDTGTGDFLSGSFSLTGIVRDNINPLTIYYDGGTDPDGLLSGSLFEFGWSGTGQNSGIIEFTFNNGDGIIADLFGVAGGMILTVNTGSSFTGSATFNNDILAQNWSGSALGDVFVPIPAALWLFVSGLAGLMGIARSRKPA